jgi:hypothetical protein
VAHRVEVREQLPCEQRMNRRQHGVREIGFSS